MNKIKKAWRWLYAHWFMCGSAILFLWLVIDIIMTKGFPARQAEQFSVASKLSMVLLIGGWWLTGFLSGRESKR